ncbi:MAG: hypothetical protein SNJ52_03155 [Verrucomicrobiia bacterium]
MDVEGAEWELLGDRMPGLLTRWRVLVEVHPWTRPNLARDLARRFERTHDVAVIPARERSCEDLPPRMRHWFLDRWSVRELREFRPHGMLWLDLVPKNK